MAVQTLLQIRRGSSSTWTSTNPTLSSGEWGYETDTGKYKIGDGLTAWTSLSYASVIPSAFIGNSGIGVTQGTNGTNLTISVTGITSSQMNDFNSAVDARITAASISEEQVQDVVGSGDHVSTGFLRNGTGVVLDYNDGSNTLTINVSGYSYLGHTHTSSDITDFNTAVTGVTESLYSKIGHTHTSSNITDFNSSVSGLLPGVTGVSGVAVGFANNVYTVSLSDPSIQVGDITDFVDGVNDRVADLLTAGSNIQLTYTDSGNDTSTLQISATGVALTGHTHVLADITNVTANATEVNYLDGTTLGTVTSGNVVAVDANKDISGFRDISLDRNLTVGGNLTVNGTTTTVNSTIVDIGDNIIQVNVSGAATQGGLQVLDHDNSETHKLVWDIDNSRWEFSGPTSPDIYTSGNLSANIITSTVGSGTAPFTVTSPTIVTNLNADKLDDQDGSYYLDWNNTTNKPDPIITGVLTGDITGSASVTLTDLANGTLTINTTLGANVVGSGNIIDGSIINDDINANAGISVTKLAAGSAGQVLQVNSSGTIVWGSIDGGTP